MPATQDKDRTILPSGDGFGNKFTDVPDVMRSGLVLPERMRQISLFSSIFLMDEMVNVTGIEPVIRTMSS